MVRPGEKVPIDGVVVEGTSTLNTSALTGESVPREITVDQDVISGCVNLTGLLKIRTTKEFGESTVSKILDLVENSSMKKSKSENFITKFARYYTPAVCYSALALAILPPVINLIMGNPAAWSTHHSCADFPGNQLPLCTGHFHSPFFLRRNRSSKCLWYSGEGVQLSGSAV